jgi:hypothetical protein
MTPDQAMKVAILEKNRSVGQRIARVMRSGAFGNEVLLDTDLRRLREQVGSSRVVLACDEADADHVLEWAHGRPDTQVIAWTMDKMDRLIQLAEESPRLASLIAWPSFASMPRSWELLLAMTRAVNPEHRLRFGELLDWGAAQATEHPRTSAERDAVVARVAAFAERVGAGARIVQSVGEIAHEMLMNAMYDAPVDQYGSSLYANDRKQALVLRDEEVPAFSFGADGTNLVMTIRDPFGGLRRDHITEALTRGLRASNGDSDVLNVRNGGAGLGLFKMYSLSSALAFEVVGGARTVATCWIDLDLSGRDARSLASSIHFP